MKKLINSVLNFSILSIISINPISLNGNELNGFNKVFQVFNNQNLLNQNLNNEDKIKLVGISKFDKPLILLEINGSVFEIILGQEKFDYTFYKVENSIIFIKKNNIEYQLKIGEEPVSIKVKSSVFTSNLSSEKLTSNIISNREIINQELKRFKNSVTDKILEIPLNDFERDIINEVIKTPGRSDAGRLGFKIPSKIINQSVNKFGLKENDVILSINNIPMDKINDIYSLYKNKEIKTYFIEVKRSNKLVMVEWYK